MRLRTPFTYALTESGIITVDTPTTKLTLDNGLAPPRLLSRWPGDPLRWRDGEQTRPLSLRLQDWRGGLTMDRTIILNDEAYAVVHEYLRKVVEQAVNELKQSHQRGG